MGGNRSRKPGEPQGSGFDSSDLRHGRLARMEEYQVANREDATFVLWRLRVRSPPSAPGGRQG